jgi:hypothetical protein
MKYQLKWLEEGWVGAERFLFHMAHPHGLEVRVDNCLETQ